ncbi:hypothetical protein [uncultured Sphingomonas sp.]|nr:hypothetical protein [uncultured Sphingomonas sp.]
MVPVEAHAQVLHTNLIGHLHEARAAGTLAIVGGAALLHVRDVASAKRA